MNGKTQIRSNTRSECFTVPPRNGPVLRSLLQHGKNESLSLLFSIQFDCERERLPKNHQQAEEAQVVTCDPPSIVCARDLTYSYL